MIENERFLGNYEDLQRYQNNLIKIYKRGFYQKNSLLNILNLDILNIIDNYIGDYDPRTPQDLYDIYKNDFLKNINLSIELKLVEHLFNIDSLLHILSIMGDTLGINTLIQKYNYEYNQEIVLMYGNNSIKVTPILATLFSINKNRYFECFLLYYDKYKCQDFIIDSSDRCLIHYAAETDNLAIIKYLVNLGFDPLHSDKEMNLPIHFAARSGSLEILKYYHNLGFNLKPGFNSDINDNTLQTFVSSCLVLLYYGLTSSILNDNWFVISVGLISCNGNIELLPENDRFEITEIFDEIKNIEPEKYNKYNECISYIINL